MEEAEEEEINAPAVVEEVAEAVVAVVEIVPPRNLIKDRPVDLDDVTLAVVVTKDVAVVAVDVRVPSEALTYATQWKSPSRKRYGAPPVKSRCRLCSIAIPVMAAVPSREPIP